MATVGEWSVSTPMNIVSEWFPIFDGCVSALKRLSHCSCLEFVKLLPIKLMALKVSSEGMPLFTMLMFLLTDV